MVRAYGVVASLLVGLALFVGGCIVGSNVCSDREVAPKQKVDDAVADLREKGFGTAKPERKVETPPDVGGEVGGVEVRGRTRARLDVPFGPEGASGPIGRTEVGPVPDSRRAEGSSASSRPDCPVGPVALVRPIGPDDLSGSCEFEDLVVGNREVVGRFVWKAAVRIPTASVPPSDWRIVERRVVAPPSSYAVAADSIAAPPARRAVEVDLGVDDPFVRDRAFEVGVAYLPKPWVGGYVRLSRTIGTIEPQEDRYGGAVGVRFRFEFGR